MHNSSKYYHRKHIHGPVKMWLGMIVLLVAGCATQKPQTRVSNFFHFTYEGQDYRIRSICSDVKGQSYNELVGPNMVATDYDQDQYIDRVNMGEGTLAHAQAIYAFGLSELGAQNKIETRYLVTDSYVHSNHHFTYEIISFRPAGEQPFNKFRIIDNRPIVPEMVIFIDKNADGTLDESLNGHISVEKAQQLYRDTIQSGLQQGKLVKSEHMILVKNHAV